MSDMVPARSQTVAVERPLFSSAGSGLCRVSAPPLDHSRSGCRSSLVGAMGLFKQTGAYVASSKVLLELQSSQSPTLVISNRQVDYDLSISTYRIWR